MIAFPTFSEEQQLWNQGYEYIIGIDEVGRGAFAGPVTVGAVVFPPYFATPPRGIHDSKLLSPKARETISEDIYRSAFIVQLETVEVDIINAIGITKATILAMQQVIKKVTDRLVCQHKNPQKSFVLLDGLFIPSLNAACNNRQKAIIKGDQKSLSIAAASIVAKVHRDALMKELGEKYASYGFELHKGYGTKYHQNALKQYGLSPLHRTSFQLSRFLV